uniref:Uncharacterized protein n=1 Tax=Populus trichocarpa TaxID=3694 RepID=A0A3N7F324_POPTR
MHDPPFKLHEWAPVMKMFLTFCNNSCYFYYNVNLWSHPYLT